MQNSSGNPTESKDETVHGQAIRVVDAQELLSNASELRILHHGQEYRLRLTRQDKLILTK